MNKLRSSFGGSKIDWEHRNCRQKGFEGNKRKPTALLSSKTQSDFSGPASKRPCPMAAKANCEIAPGRKIIHNESNAVKVESAQKSKRGSNDQCSNREYSNVARIPTKSGSLGSTVNHPELSPSKALRIAKLRDRFSETILKFQNKTTLKQGGGTDEKALQKEWVMLLKKQQEERAELEARIKAVKSAAPFKKEFELKQQRQAEREAARIANEKMERTVFIDDNRQVLNDLKEIIGQPFEVMCQDDKSRAGTGNLQSPLQQLGLHIKEEYKVGNEYDVSMDEVWEDLEEGEII